MESKNRNIRLVWASVLAVCALAFSAACSPQAAEDKTLTISGRVLPGNPVDEGLLPIGSRITVQVQDTSIADAEAVLLGEQIITEDASLPAAYAISVDPAAIEETAQITVSARIEDTDGQLLFINDILYPVALDSPEADVVVYAIDKHESSPLPQAFDGQTWHWLAFIDSASDAESNDIEVEDPSQYTLELLKDGTYVIQADCNRGGGNFSLEGSSLVLEPGFMTLVACPPESLSDRFVSLLGNVVTFVLDADGQLVLNLKMDAGDMIFAPAPTATRTLTNTLWALQSITVRDARIGSDYDVEITAEFKDGQVTGSGGCNNYFGGYVTENNQLTIDKLGSTLMSCGETRDQREREFLTGLEMVRSYQIDGDTLSLLDANQNTVIVMVAKDTLE